MSVNDKQPTEAVQIRQFRETWAAFVRDKHMEGSRANHAPDLL